MNINRSSTRNDLRVPAITTVSTLNQELGRDGRCAGHAATSTGVGLIPATSCLLDGRFLSKLFLPTLIIMATMGMSAQPNRFSVYG
ncbi:hypothetical protein Y032_0013g2014 [Ancylostoma ceylanicum]|uniref:Uncharacterized protein n=1 Tax=Ancylostoma ceylanicum TaxID=53326 RepID=A0A016VAF7_9BILA|nr:hypothetical protein Y032_0013g2014 [Ancylostoma ceylanicum]